MRSRWHSRSNTDAHKIVRKVSVKPKVSPFNFTLGARDEHCCCPEMTGSKFPIDDGWRYHFHTFKDPLVSVHSEGPMNVRAFIVRTGANREVRDWVSQGEHHLLLLVRHTRLLIDPPFSPHTPVLGAHPSLQFLQPLLHMRGHLQTAKMKIMQDSTAEQMAPIWEMRHQLIKDMAA